MHLEWLRAETLAPQSGFIFVSLVTLGKFLNPFGPLSLIYKMGSKIRIRVQVVQISLCDGYCKGSEVGEMFLFVRT